MEEITGYIKSIVFYNEKDSFLIAKIRLDQKADEIVTIKGNIQRPRPEELIRYVGEYIIDPKFGYQFKVSSYEKVLPTDILAIVRFLSSSVFPNVGPKSARRVVDALGLDCLKKIKEDNSVLDQVNLQPDQRQSIIAGLCNHSNLEKAIEFFVGYGLDMRILIKLDAIYKDKMIETISANPYVMIRDVDGVGFKTADNVAAKMGINQHDPRRLEALLPYCANEICYHTQNTYTDAHEIYQKASEYVGDMNYDDFESALRSALGNNEIIQEGEHLFPTKLYEAESMIAKDLVRYIYNKPVNSPKEILEAEITQIENEMGIRYSEDQKAAIVATINSGLTIITGGPGTGKTTVVNAIIRVYSSLFSDDSIHICAPTGRAAKRIGELAGHSASTIHRLLGWDLETNTFAKSASDPVGGDFLIVDEFSMVDCQLFYHLLDATQGFKKILLIGDEQQLPPVSPGDVLRDLLELGKINVVNLTTIHRQSDNSGIIPLCYDVRHGALNEANLAKEDVAFIACRNTEAKDYILNIIQKAVDKGFNQQDIQVLAPKYAGVAGITNLNFFIREFFNPANSTKDEVTIGSKSYRIGDKILQLKNQPDDDVYNGDIGILEEIERDPDEPNNFKLIINFDGNLVTYGSEKFDNITHAYCISVHKAQGSEYRLVVMPIFREYGNMLRKKLIYTGISRAKESLLLLGELDTLKQGIRRHDMSVRKTSLKERLKHYLDQ